MTNMRYGIRKHFAWMTLLPLLVMAVGLESYFLTDRYSDLDRDLLTRGQLLARQLAASSEYGVFSSNRSFLTDLTKSTLREADVQAAIVLNAASEVLVASGDTQIPLASLLVAVDREHPVLDDGNRIILYQPVFSAQVALDETEPDAGPRQIGAVVVEMNWQQTKDLKLKLVWTTIPGALALLLVTLFMVYLASRRIIDHISRLSIEVDAIGAGDLDARVTSHSPISELCTLTDGINTMAIKLQQEHTFLQQRIDDATEQLRNLAFYDTLTLLPNRRLLNDRLAQTLASSKRSGRYGAVMFLDLDNFKPLNDRFGHAVGDLLLIEAARRIGNCLREVDTVARFGGDEFVVMLSELDVDEQASINQAAIVAEKIRVALGEPYHLVYQYEGKEAISIEHLCTSSIGVTLFLNHLASQDEILVQADAAMYQAKQGGRNSIRFFARSDTDG